MKKITASLLIASLLLTGSAGAIFEDIPDATTKQAAISLYSLGIVSGTGNGMYTPTRTLTRAEFTTMAVKAMGEQAQTSTFSIFADVPYSHWAASFVNAAVRSETAFINGYADGTFRPDATVNYAEVCTMLLRMLGYTVEDIGANWPVDYIARAEQLNLNGGVRKNASDPIDRGTAAIMLQRVLTTPCKDGSVWMDSLSGASVVQDAILLATAQTDSSLSGSQARFYINGEAQVVRTSQTLDASLIGAQGTILYDTNETSLVSGFVPTGGRSEQRTISGISASGLQTTMGYLAVPRNTPTMVLGEVMEYDECWFDLPVGSTVSLLYTSTGDLEMITATGSMGSSSVYQGDNLPTWNGGYSNTTTPNYGGTVYVYPAINPATGYPDVWGNGASYGGSSNGGYVNPFEGSLLKNGVSISASDVDKYDVLTTDASGMTLVSDTRITGMYDDASPSFRSPEVIEILGEEYNIPANVALQFADLQAGDRITVLFDVYGRVAGVTDSKSAIRDMIGVVTDASGAQVTVALFNGLTISGELEDYDADDDQTQNGTLVAVEVSKDGLELSSAKMDTASKGDWNVTAGMLGNSRVAGNVQVFEMAENRDTIVPLTRAQMPTGTVKSSDIHKAYCDSNGTVIAIVLDDYTGEAWVYGWAEVEEVEVIDYDTVLNQDDLDAGLTTEPEYDTYLEYKFTFVTADDAFTVTLEDEPRDGLVGIPATFAQNPRDYADLDTTTLYKIDTVELSDFNGYDTVRADGKTLNLADDVPVYLKGQDKYFTLRQAKANYDDFILYADSKTGGTVRMIVVN